VFFSDIAGNRVLKRDAKGAVTTFRADSGRTNGNCFDARGRLVNSEGGEQGPGRRRAVRTDMTTGAVMVLTDRFGGRCYTSPNDCCVGDRGRVWSTDPRYGADRSDLEMDVEGVYRIDGAGQVERVLTPKEVSRLNGIAVAPDDKALYVIGSHPREGGHRRVWAFDLAADGPLSGQRPSTTAARAAAATACGSMGTGTCGWRPASTGRAATRASRWACPPAST
jgi:gluconolactonase